MEPNETTRKKVWASFNILYSLYGIAEIRVSQCVKALLWVWVWGLLHCTSTIVGTREMHRIAHRGMRRQRQGDTATRPSTLADSTAAATTVTAPATCIISGTTTTAAAFTGTAARCSEAGPTAAEDANALKSALDKDHPFLNLAFCNT